MKIFSFNNQDELWDQTICKLTVNLLTNVFYKSQIFRKILKYCYK